MSAYRPAIKSRGLCKQDNLDNTPAQYCGVTHRFTRVQLPRRQPEGALWRARKGFQIRRMTINPASSGLVPAPVLAEFPPVAAMPAAAAPFLAVARYLAAPLPAQALSLALERGWIDRLLRGPCSMESLRQTGGAPVTAEGMALLSALLAEAGIAAADSLGRLVLTRDFRAALVWRDLIEARLWFAAMAARDLATGFADFVTRPAAFMAGSQVFGLFRYDLCLSDTPEAREQARPWVAYTSVLTKYESAPALDLLGLSTTRRMLDLGGNSGAFARAACRAAPDLRAVVFDLPAVCGLGHEMVQGSAEAARIGFHPGDLRRDPLPQGFDLITMKSVLHDWPEPQALDFLTRAVTALPPGGRIAIYERGPLTPQNAGPLSGHDAAANVVFQPFYRDPAPYRRHLAGLGLHEAGLHRIRLDVDFTLLIWEKPGAGDGPRPAGPPPRAPAVVTPYPGEEISAHGCRMLAAIEALDCPFGYEHSAKFSAGGINRDRWVVSLHRSDLDAVAGPKGTKALLRDLCLSLGAAAGPLDALLSRLGRAGILHFGHEGGRDPIRKLYLEYADEVEAARVRRSETPVLVFESLKWRMSDPTAARLNHYRWCPAEADPLAQLSRWDRDGQTHPAARFGRAVAGHVPAHRLTRMDVTEEGSARLSFDLNLYRLARDLGQAAGAMADLAAGFGLDPATVGPILRDYGASRLGHIAGGWGGDGRAFATVYYGIQGRRGRDAAAMLLPQAGPEGHS